MNRTAVALLVVATVTSSAEAGPRKQSTRDRRRAGGVSERKPDRLDRLFERGGVVDLHADTALHGLDLPGNGKPGRAMRAWISLLRAAGVVQPKVRHFTRHVTEDSLRRQGSGVQVFSAVTRGVAPAYRLSAKLFARWFARYPRRATRSDVTLWLEQAAWVYRQVEQNPDLLVLTPDLATTVAAVKRGRVGAQLAVEGGFPFEASRRNRRALRRFFADPKLDLPGDFPRPTADELASGNLLAYARRLGVQYIGLNHLASSCFSGSELRPNRRRGRGLSPLGRRFVADAWSAGIMIDLAHASRQAQRDVVALVRASADPLPLLVSHAVFSLDDPEGSWRSTLPEVLPAVRDSGGVVGIIGARVHLPHGGAREPGPVVADIADQIDFVRRRIGVDHIALGLDGDGFVGQAHATTREVAEAVRTELVARGYSRSDVAKIFGGNYLHVLARRDRLLRQRGREP